MVDVVLCKTADDVAATAPISGFYPVECWPLRGSSFFTVGALSAWPNGKRSWRLFHGGSHKYSDEDLAGRRIGSRLAMPGEPLGTNWPPVVAYMQSAVETFPGEVVKLRHATQIDPYDGGVMDSVTVEIASLPEDDVGPWVEAADRIHRAVEQRDNALVGMIALHVRSAS